VVDAAGLVAIFNKDSRDVDVTIAVATTRFKHATAERLEAPAIAAKTGVTLGGAAVSSTGQFQHSSGEPLNFLNGKLSVKIPAYSAVLIRLA